VLINASTSKRLCSCFPIFPSDPKLSFWLSKFIVLVSLKFYCVSWCEILNNLRHQRSFSAEGNLFNKNHILFLKNRMHAKIARTEWSEVYKCSRTSRCEKMLVILVHLLFSLRMLDVMRIQRSCSFVKHNACKISSRTAPVPGLYFKVEYTNSKRLIRQHVFKNKSVRRLYYI